VIDSGAVRPPRRIAVIGAGISGLAAAWTLAAAGESVVVLETAGQVGGKLRIESVAGVRVDVGAEAVLARRPEAVGLIAELGLADEQIAPLTSAALLRVGGGLHPLPQRTVLGIPADEAAARASGALTAHALGRIAAEPNLDPLRPLSHDISVGALVRGRLGNEIADRLVEPLLGGVYAGRADELSLRATVPALATRLGEGGSLVRAAQAVLEAGPSAATGPIFTSLAGGLGRLPTALAASGRFDVRTGVTVRSIRRTATGFLLDCGAVPEPESIEVDGVVIATPAAKAARLLGEIAPAAAGDLAGIDSASVAIVTFAFAGVALPAGSGLLVGAREGVSVKGVTITSQKWSLDSRGLTVLRASLGRAGDAQVLQREDADLIRLARHDMAEMLGLRADPVDALVTRWGGGLPQYAVGHIDRIIRVRAAVAGVAGLGVCGAAYDGVGIPACIASARAAAEQVLTSLERGTMTS